jgi:hypothetical protein
MGETFFTRKRSWQVYPRRQAAAIEQGSVSADSLMFCPRPVGGRERRPPSDSQVRARPTARELVIEEQQAPLLRAIGVDRGCDVQL